MRYLPIVLMSLCLLSCSNIASKKFDAWVDKYSHQDAQHFSTIEAAIQAAPDNLSKPFRIFVAPGNYYEKIAIKKSWIHLIGSSAEKTRLYYDAYAGQKDPQGTTWGTPGSATLTLSAQFIQIENITVENSFDYWQNEMLATDDPKYVANAQAVALFLDTGSDKVIVRHTKLLGHQDTLFINQGRSWFDQVFIQGHVDFIFGKGNALFTDSEIKNIARAKPGKIQGFVTAPSTQITNDYGFTFINCRLTRDKNVSDESVPLGRPWHPTTQFSDGRYADPKAVGKAVFINTWMEKHITTEGWYSMKGTAKDGTKIDFNPEDSRFFEYKSRGPGAKINNSRRQISAEDIQHYSVDKIFGDWNPF